MGLKGVLNAHCAQVQCLHTAVKIISFGNETVRRLQVNRVLGNECNTSYTRNHVGKLLQCFPRPSSFGAELFSGLHFLMLRINPGCLFGYLPESDMTAINFTLSYTNVVGISHIKKTNFTPVTVTVLMYITMVLLVEQWIVA